MSENFFLKWNDFHSNASEAFRRLRNDDYFHDVTLVSDDQKQLTAHKVVLSACSEYFNNILKQNKHPNPLLCLEGVNSEDLNNVLDYVYHGEVKIYQDDLDRFLKIAERLKLEGLMSDAENVIGESKEVPERKVFTNEDYETFAIDTDDSDNKFVIPQNSKIMIDSEEFASIEELDATILEKMEKEGNKWKCKICCRIMRTPSYLKEHIEIHFDGLSFQCPECNATARSRQSLRHHIRKHTLKR